MVTGGPHEFELSIPHPAEDVGWLERQIEEFIKANTDAEGLLEKQHSQYEAARRYVLRTWFPGDR